MSPPLGRIQLGAAVLGALLGGCVSSQTYQSSQAALGAERRALQQARVGQQTLTTRVAELTEELAAAQSRLLEQEQRIEQSELASSVARQERDRIASLVDQLREELGRAGDHLRAFSGEKRELRQLLARVTEAPGARLEVRLPQGSRPGSQAELQQGLEACGLSEQSFVVVAQADPGAADELRQPGSEVLIAEPSH
jgi:hypothetical protein